MTFHVLGELAIGELEQFLGVFTTDGLEKRRQHGCEGAQVFRPAGEDGRVLVLLTWPDQAAFDAFRADPETGPIMGRGGAQGPPTFTPLERVADLEA